MSTVTSTATKAGDGPHINGIQYSGSNSAAETTGIATRPLKASERKYNHAVAIHSRTQVSPLSAGADPAPNFIGFRNLMILVLGKYYDALCVILAR